MVLLRLMFVDRGGSAAGRNARVEGIRESERAIERRTSVRSMVLFGCGGERCGREMARGCRRRKNVGIF